MMSVILALALLKPLWAEESQDFQPGDALYAPEDETPGAESFSGAAASSGSYYSTAKISVADFAHGMKPLEGAELFIDGHFVGKSPLDLGGYLINKPAVALTARLSGYHDAAREALKIPAEGEARIAMVGDNAASWYTTPSWIAGLLMLGGAVAAYSQNNSSGSGAGIALVGGGVGVFVISQGIARLFHLPSLDKDVAALNSKSEAVP